MNTQIGSGLSNSSTPILARSSLSRGASRPSRLVNLQVHDSDLVSEQVHSSSSNALPTISTNTNPSNTNTDSLTLEIAADYTTANMEAVVANVSNADVAQDELSLAIREHHNTVSIDEVARTAAEAIATIRTSTNPDDIAKQISALQEFANNIKSNPDLPEMLTLADTIEKFITVASKSTGIQAQLNKKPSQSISATSSNAIPAIRRTVSGNGKVILTRNYSIASRTAATPHETAIATSTKKPLLAPKSTKLATTKVKSKTKTSSTNRISPAPKDKDAALRKALHSVASMDEKQPVKAKSKRTTKTTKRRSISYRKKGVGKRFVLALGCAAACVAAILYFVGSNIPDISVRVAAMQTGVEASYPSYVPRDFSLEGINSENGKITLSFTGPNNTSFTLVEEKSSWDSTALLRNYVEPSWHENYTTTHEQGITIYINGSNATWVNGGVLYKINSSGNTLTKKQLRNIVTSMQ